MKKDITPAGIVASGIEMAWENVTASFERFCLTAGIATLSEMMEQDAVELCGSRHERGRDRRGYRWGRTTGALGFHRGEAAVERPRVRTGTSPPRRHIALAQPFSPLGCRELWPGRRMTASRITAR